MTIQIARRIGRALGVRSGTRIKELDDGLREYARLVAQSPTIPMLGSIAASQVTSGTFADGRISQSSVIQHEAALSIDWLQLSSVPTAFTPAAHTHGNADLIDLAYSKLTGVPATFTPANHLVTGTWAPTDESGAGLAFTAAVGTYEKHEGLVVAKFEVEYPATADVSQAVIGGLPFAIGSIGESNCQAFVTLSNHGSVLYLLPLVGQLYFRIYTLGAAAISNASMASKYLYGAVIYRA